MLTVSAVKRVAPTHDQTLQRMLARAARFTGPAVYRQALLETPALARTQIIANGRSPFADGVAQYAFNGVHQVCQGGLGQIAR